jgi:4-amino-4-deoxy-L-arabinose transferase-like glycosyltransferase
LLIVLLGCALRLYRLGSIPPGLNSDEASAGLEALGLLLTSADRWGNPWPVYFPGWGSGLSVLYSYLSMPVLWLFGPNVVSIRLVNAVFGCLTLPVVWFLARQQFGTTVALVATALVAFLPWHVTLSRWALDANLLPFWFTLGLLTLGMALRPEARPWSCVVALLPWAVGVYAYGAGVVPMALSALILLAFHWRSISARSGWWVLGALLALAIDIPFLLFLVKNQVLHRDLGFEAALPFSVPLLASSRLAQAQESAPIMVWRNLIFFLDAWRDGLLWNHSAKFAPLSGLMPWLVLLGTIDWGMQTIRRGRPNPTFVAVLSLLGAAVLFLFNVNRINWFFIPAMILAAHGLVRLCTAVTQPAARTAFVAATVLYFGSFAGASLIHYFTRYTAELIAWEDEIHDAFRVGLHGALDQAVAQAAPAEPILAEVATFHPYVWILFYGYDDLESFRQTRRMEVRDGIYHVSGFGRFIFDRGAVPAGQPFTFLVRPETALPCPEPRIHRSDAMWVVGHCPAPGAS